MKKSLYAFASVLVFTATNATAGPIFSSDSYSDSLNFSDVLSRQSMTVAYDGSNYWSASGGSSSGARFAQYDSAGNSISTFSPGIDFRSVFTDTSGNVLARVYRSSTIYSQTSPGVFSPYLTLSGGSLNLQSSVVMNDNGEFVAMNNGNVTVWDAFGNLSSTFALAGYRSDYPANRGVAVADDYLFTYFDRTLSAWDYAGNLLDQTSLLGAGTSYDSYFSLSYANNHIFVIDASGKTWRGYDIGLSTSVPEPGSLALLALGVVGIRLSRKRKAA